MNNLQIKKAIRENLKAKSPKKAWGESDDLMVNRMTMDAEKQMKTARESLPGMTRAEAWAMVRDQFLTAR